MGEESGERSGTAKQAPGQEGEHGGRGDERADGSAPPRSTGRGAGSRQRDNAPLPQQRQARGTQATQP